MMLSTTSQLRLVRRQLTRRVREGVKWLEKSPLRWKVNVQV